MSDIICNTSVRHARPESQHELQSFYNNPLTSHKVWTSSYNPLVSTTEDDDPRKSPSHILNDTPSASGFNPKKIGWFGGSPWTEAMFSVFTLLVSVPFIWLVVVIRHYHNERVTDDATRFIQQYTRTASTFFTIFFAAVFGVSLKRFATYRVEKGIKLGLLEQIMQSRTVFAALATQIYFRFFNLVALALIMTWAFSPLGSQASLRLVYIGTSTTSHDGIVSYFDTLRSNVFNSASGSSSLLTTIKPLYASSLLGSATVKNGPMDLWGSVKIPYLMEKAVSDSNGWVDLTSFNQTEDIYSSLIGLPVKSLANENSTFTIESTYMKLDCSKPVEENFIPYVRNGSLWTNGTFNGPDLNFSTTTWVLAMDQFVNDNLYIFGYPEQYIQRNATNIVPQATLLFQTIGRFNSRCKINQVYVDSNISCHIQTITQAPVCLVTAQRKSPKVHAPSTFTALSPPSAFSYVSRLWALSVDLLLSSGYSSLTEYYIQNTTTESILRANNRRYANYTTITAEVFSLRLGQLLNTFMMSSLFATDNFGGSANGGLAYQNSSITYSERYEVYQCSWAWMAIYCTSTAVMLLIALIGAWCNFRTTVPDILGYCSTVVRDSRYFQSKPGGSTMSGLEWAKMYQRMDLKLGDIGEHPVDYDVGTLPNRVGYLAMGPKKSVLNPRRGMLYA